MTLPPGYVAVPEEPTEAIRWAIRREVHRITGYQPSDLGIAEIYAEAIAARPPLPDNQEGAARDIPACSCPYDEAPHPCQWRYSLAECLAAARSDNQEGGDLVSYYERQIEWSRETFGPALRTKGVIQHIRKELAEIEADPHDLSEWVDVIILAMDGFWRHGGKATGLMPALLAKQAKNMARTWPDWRTMSEDHAIEHDRSTDNQEGGDAPFQSSMTLASPPPYDPAPGHTPAGGEVFGTPTVAFQNRYQSPLYQEGGDAPSTRKSTTTGRPESTSACEPAPGHTPAGGEVCPTCGGTRVTYCLGVDENATCPTCKGTGHLPAEPAQADAPDRAAEVERVPWRIGNHYRLHVYEGDVPVATALTAALAQQIVAEHNAALTPAPDGDEVERACAALRAAYLCSPDGTWVQGGTEKIVRMVLRAALTAKETKG